MTIARKKSFKLTVKGKVQGVYYRKHTALYAKSCQLNGTVQNLENGDVEILITASNEELEHFMRLLRIGSPNSEVDEIIIEEIPTLNHSDFQIIR